jgi:GNAT superfamily N-acetyltransferase
MTGDSSLTIRDAKPADAALVYSLVRELADYERLSDEVSATADDIASALFAPQPRLFCDLAEWGGTPAGFAMWFVNFSSFRGRHGIYLEDIFVRPAFRAKGIGKALMRGLAGRCLAQGYGRFEWAVLGWNASAIDFYRNIGANVLDDWRICRLSGDALAQFAGRGAR